MGIPISRELAERLIDLRWGSPRQMASGWADRISDGFQKTGEPRDAKSIYRWLAKGLPNEPDAVFGFAAALGVDPVALIDIESSSFQADLYKEWLKFVVNMQSHGKFSSLWPMVRPGVFWPQAAISHDYYDCKWSVCTFRHSADQIANVYAQISILGESDEDEASTHRVYYFAYKREGARDGLWRPYGIVRRRGTEAICIAHNGDMGHGDEDEPARFVIGDDGLIQVETFFGPGPTDFKVACLHPFSVELCAPSRARGSLRFTA